MRRMIIVWSIAGIAVVAIMGVVVASVHQGWFGSPAQRLFNQATAAQRQQRYAEAQAHVENLLASFADSPLADDALLKLAELLEAQQQLIPARAMYRKLLEQFPNAALATTAQARLGQVNLALLFSPTVTDYDIVHQVRPGDTLGRIAGARGTTVEFLKRANGLKSDVIRPGQPLKVPKGRFSMVVDKSQNQLLLTQDNQFIKTYVVATGKENSTPVGTFRIVNKLTHPVWYKQGAIVPPESPENILGTRWMGIDKEGYGIHGSVDPTALGQQATAGCVRMSNSDVEELYDLVPMGTEVTIVD